MGGRFFLFFSDGEPKSMKAMILAAGLGSRLRPLTDSCPKALIEIEGTPMLEIVARRLITFGVREIVINVHHLAEQVIDFLKSRANFEIHIEISHEQQLLDTGGGLKQVARFFDDNEPFLLHNVDVLSTVDFSQLTDSHRHSGALATLLAAGRPSRRYFLFDQKNRLCGWESVAGNKRIMAIPEAGEVRQLAFNGIHVISPRIFPLMNETGVFSINAPYLRLAAQGEIIQACLPGSYYWRDIGKMEQLETIRQEVREQRLKFY